MRRYGHRGFLKRLKWIGLPALLRLRFKWLLFLIFKWIEYPSFFLLQNRSVSRNSGRLHDLWVICSKSTDRLMIFTHEVRLYTRKQLENMLGKAGFLVNHVYGGYEGQTFSDESSRLIISAELESFRQLTQV
jgi:hypothetical protein